MTTKIIVFRSKTFCLAEHDYLPLSSQACHALSAEVRVARSGELLLSSRKLLLSAERRDLCRRRATLPWPGGGGASSYRATLQRTDVSAYISGTLLEVVLSIGNRGENDSPPCITTSPLGWAVLKGPITNMNLMKFKLIKH